MIQFLSETPHFAIYLSLQCKDHMGNAQDLAGSWKCISHEIICSRDRYFDVLFLVFTHPAWIIKGSEVEPVTLSSKV